MRRKKFIFIAVFIILFTGVTSLLVRNCFGFRTLKNFNSATGWNLQYSGININLNSVYFVNSQTGYIAGDSGKILKTINGGVNWIQQNSGTTLNLKCIRFFNELTGWACGGDFITSYPFSYEYGIVLNTTNGGSDWVVRINPVIGSNIYHDISITGLNDIYVVSGGSAWYWGGSYGAINKTTNSGSNWQNYIFGPGPFIAFKSIDFINNATGWSSGLWFSDVGAQKSHICKTTNQGINWTTYTIDSSNSLPIQENTFQQLRFLDANTGYFLQFYLRKTSNSGLNWFNTDSLSTVSASNFYFINSDTGWIVFPSGGIKRTNNGGYNWINQNTPVNGFRGIYFVNALTGWAVGNNGIIVKTTTGGVTSVKNISGEVPNEFFMGQNYPNPFNAVTIIRFQIGIGSRLRGNDKVVLKVFDLAGREVRTLVDERLEAGTYEVRFDVRLGGSSTDLPSGVYFYRMEAGRFMETRKLIILK
ncbi:MAG: T9SS type A sorting domain-containing protein [Ignavibacteria bacterium]|nr:T9SS type A sorting domain-containing protein [Ignavibacteria bacterium]